MAPKFISEHPFVIRTGVVGALLLAVVGYVATHTSHQPPPKPPPVITMVIVQPPKPPPPPPPPLPQPKIVQPQKVVIPNVKPLVPNQPPKPAPPRPAAPSAVPLGTSIHNNGPADAFNLGGNPGGNGFLGGGGGGGGGGTYGEAVSYAISQALQHNKTTRTASAGLRVQLWVSGAGNVTRVALLTSSGHPDVDSAVRDQVLAHLQLPPPPAGTPMPMLLSLTGQASL